MKTRLQELESAHAAAGLWPLDETVANAVPARDHGGVIEWDHVSAIPLPWVIEDDSPEAMAAWRGAIREWRCA